MDFFSISVMIAYSYTPAYILLLEYGPWVIAVSTALAGLSAMATLKDNSRFFATAVYSVQGTVGVVMLLPMGLTNFEVACFAMTLVCYGLGALGYTFEKPVLWPHSFGFHEVWHILVGIAAMGTCLLNRSIIERAQIVPN